MMPWKFWFQSVCWWRCWRGLSRCTTVCIICGGRYWEHGSSGCWQPVAVMSSWGILPMCLPAYCRREVLCRAVCAVWRMIPSGVCAPWRNLAGELRGSRLCRGLNGCCNGHCMNPWMLRSTCRKYIRIWNFNSSADSCPWRFTSRNTVPSSLTELLRNIIPHWCPPGGELLLLCLGFAHQVHWKRRKRRYDYCLLV